MEIRNLNKRLDRMDRNNRRSASRRRPGRIKRLLISFIVLGLILLVFVYLPARSAYSAVKQLSASSKLISQGVKSENLDQIQTGLDQTQTAMQNLDGSLNWFFWMNVIPVLGGYYSDSKHFSDAGNQELLAVQTITKSLVPYKQELGFTGKSIPGQDRIAQLSKVLDKVLPHLDEIAPELKTASDDVASIDTSKYPDKFGSHQIRSNVEAAKNIISGAYVAVTQAKPLLQVAPALLGDPTSKNYLILFQNDKELRATGGFLTAYSSVTLDHGHLSTSGSDDIYRLDEQLLNVCKTKVCPLTPPEPISIYLPEANGQPRTAWSMRDSNFSPDFPTAMKQFEAMYKLLGNGFNYDGIITIDTEVVKSLIQLTGPVDVLGTSYSDNIESACNCSDVVYQLENYSEIVAKGQSDRKAILGTLMQQILGKTLSTSTQKLPDLINTAVNLLNGKHIQVYMLDPQIESAFSQMGWTGEIKQINGDYLAINDSNFAGGKSNLYVTEDVTLDITTDQNGMDKHVLTIKYANPQPYNNWLNAINRDYVRVYVPQGSTLDSARGSQAKVNTQDDLGKTYFDGFIQVRPQNSLTLTYQYEVPTKVKDGKYPLLIQKQGGTKVFHYNININGKTAADFNLDSDKSLQLPL